MLLKPLEDTVGRKMSMNKTYSELIKLNTFKERYDYLKLDGVVGKETFGAQRYLNQALYTSKEWRDFRRHIIIRDKGCDLAMLDEDYEIQGLIIVHHLNPITLEDLENRSDCIFDPENVVCVAYNTHEAIHYGDYSLIIRDPVERKPGDTCPWYNAKIGGKNGR